MGVIKEYRRKFSLVFGVFILFLVVFITIIGSYTVDMSREIERGEQYRVDNRKEFLRIMKNTQSDLISVINEDWKMYTRQNDIDENEDKYIQNFIDSHIKLIPNSALESIVVAIGRGDEILYHGYYDERYEDYLSKLPTEFESDKGEKILNNDRFHYTGTMLSYEGEEMLVVYIGFLEDVVFENYLEVMDVGVIERLNHLSKRILYYIAGFMITIIGFGLYIMYNIGRLRNGINGMGCDEDE